MQKKKKKKKKKKTITMTIFLKNGNEECDNNFQTTCIFSYKYKTPAMFQNEQDKIVEGVVLTKYTLILNEMPKMTM